MYRNAKRFITLVIAGVAGISLLVPPPVTAANGFQAGRIIDNELFFSSGGIDVQQFLNSKVPNCDTNGATSKSYRYNSSTGRLNNGADPLVSTSRAVYGQRYNTYFGVDYAAAPYICLKNYTQDTQTKAAESGLCGQYNGATGQTAATIINEVSKACGVNQRVLLVLLQKEQSLVTDDWPWQLQYRKATGLFCPDTAACDPQYVGFFNQVYYAARQYKRYIRDSTQFGYRSGRNNEIQYNSDLNCGRSTVFILNNATAALYNYTPYQPNAGSIAYKTAGGRFYSTAHPDCGAYGNINFWQMFNDWFGPTTSDSDTDVLSFIKLNNGAGKVEDVGYSSIGLYQYVARGGATSYPAVAADGAVVPIYWPNGDLVFIRLNHGSGRTELVSYSAASGFQQLANYQLTPYPSVALDGAVVPLFKPRGDLSFIRLNHSAGRVEVVSYSPGSSYQQLSEIRLTSYPAVAPDGAVVPLFWPNGDLVFIRLNHGSGKVELVSYSMSSGYQQLVNYRLVPYPAVAPDGAVVPLFKPNGDLSFIRLNHGSGKVEIVSYSAASGFQQLSDHKITEYPAAATDGSVIPMYTR